MREGKIWWWTSISTTLGAAGIAAKSLAQGERLRRFVGFFPDLFMGTDATIAPLPGIAIATEDLETIGEIVLDQPMSQTAIIDCPSVFGSIVVDVVDLKELINGFAAAGASEGAIRIVLNDLVPTPEISSIVST